MAKKHYIKTISALAFFAFILIACFQQKNKEPYNAKLSFQCLISEKTNLQLDTNSFTIYLDSIKHTEGAFDSDYSWLIMAEFDAASFEELKQSIRETPGFCMVGAYEQFYNKNWAKIDTSAIKGAWAIDSVYVKFVEKPVGFRGEYLRFSLDTLTRIADVELTHL